MRVLPCGESAVLVEVADLPGVLGLFAALRADPPPGVTEVVPAARTVLVRFDPTRTDPARVAAALRARPTPPPGPTPAPGPLVEVPVRYDGADLAEVARRSGLSPAEVVARHTGGSYVAVFSGFAPGFAYLVGLDPALHLPRRDTPRPRVPAGAVAVAGEYTGVYPGPSPGGWHLLGRTALAVWDPARDPPALLAPGTRVRFVAVPG